MELALENLVVNSLIILIYVSFLNMNISKKRIFFSIIFLTSFNILIKMFIKNYIIESILINLINIYIVTKVKTLKELVKRYIYYIVIYFFFVGMVFFEVLLFNINTQQLYMRIILYLVDGIILKLFSVFMWKMWITKIKNYSNIYNMLIKDIGIFNMLLDTGNFLGYYEEVPIIIINEEMYLKKLKKKKRFIKTLKIESYKVKTVSGITVFKGYRFNNITIRKGGDVNKKIKEALILFTNEKIQNNMFDGILPANILIEK